MRFRRAAAESIPSIISGFHAPRPSHRIADDAQRTEAVVGLLREMEMTAIFGSPGSTQGAGAPFSHPGASVTWSQCSMNLPSLTRTVSNANAS
jgi:hypothetical protein